MGIDHFPMEFGKYVLLGRQAAGGMAEVFRAVMSQPEGQKRIVAVKCMRPELLSDDQSIKMFRDEAHLAGQLLHPNIVQIYEHGRVGMRSYIAMELVHGLDLRQILRSMKESRRRLSPIFACYVVAKAARGLDFAHRKLNSQGQPLNLVHRDVSPQNILVSYDGEVKVVDFGIAKADARSAETQAGTLKGKFSYMSPEQAHGARVDHRADIFALGCVLFEAVTGRVLFHGPTNLSILEMVRNVDMPNLRTVLPRGSEAICCILGQALAADPNDRYSYASEMAAELESLLTWHDGTVFGTRDAAIVMRSIVGGEILRHADPIRPRALPADPFSSDFVPRYMPQTNVPKFFGLQSARPLGGRSGVTMLLRSSLLPVGEMHDEQEAAKASLCPPEARAAAANPEPTAGKNMELHNQSSAENGPAFKSLNWRSLCLPIAVVLTLVFATAATVHAMKTAAIAEASERSGVGEAEGDSSAASRKIHVYVDGVDWGIEPLDQVRLSVGGHVVRFVATDAPGEAATEARPGR